MLKVGGEKRAPGEGGCPRFKMTHTRKSIWKDFVERNSTWVFFLCLLFSFVSLFGMVAVILSKELHALETAISNREEVSW